MQQKHQEKFEFVAFRYVAVECGIIAVGSVGRMLDGNAYKRVI